MFEMPKADPKAKEMMVEALMEGGMNRESAIRHVDASVAVLDNMMQTMLSGFNTQMLVLNCEAIVLMSLIAKGMQGTASTIINMMQTMALEQDLAVKGHCPCFACILERKLERPLTDEENEEALRIKALGFSDLRATFDGIKALYEKVGVKYDGKL